MKKRSGGLSASARFRCSRYPATMLALCARYQLRPVGLATNSSQSRTACDEGSPASPPRSATVSHPSRSSRSFTARHHTLPGGDASSGLSTPRRACQRITTTPPVGTAGVAVRGPWARGTPAPSMQDAPPDRRARPRPAPQPSRAPLRGGSSRGVIPIRRRQARPPYAMSGLGDTRAQGGARCHIEALPTNQLADGRYATEANGSPRCPLWTRKSSPAARSLTTSSRIGDRRRASFRGSALPGPSGIAPSGNGFSRPRSLLQARSGGPSSMVARALLGVPAGPRRPAHRAC
jgi:hypothetical protein